MKSKFWQGLIILVLMYTIIYLFVYEATYFSELPRYIRYCVRYMILIGVYLLGTYHLQLEEQKWMNAIWHIIHISGISLITLGGMYDYFIQPTPYYIRSILAHVNEFLVAPVLYFGMGLLSKYATLQK